MKFAYQEHSSSGNFATPDAFSYEEATTEEQLRSAYDKWFATVDTLDDANDKDVEIYAWIIEDDEQEPFVCDGLPDLIVYRAESGEIKIKTV